VEKLQTAQLQYPPLTVLPQPEEITNSPPPTVEANPEAVLINPPAIDAPEAPMAELQYPPEI